MKHNQYRMRLVTLLLLLGVTTAVTAQVQINVSLDTATVMIGDHIELTVDISAPAGTSIELIDYSRWEKDGPLELLDLGPLNTVAETPRLLQQQQARYITFDSGYHRLPPLALIYRSSPEAPLDTVYSGDLGLQVFTLPVQTETEIRDNKDIIEEPFRWMDAWPLYTAVGVLLLALLLWQWWRSRTQEAVAVPVPPPPPAHVLALDKLAALAADKAWERGEIKAFQSDLTYVLREYLDARYQLSTLEATTPETLLQLRQIALPEAAYAQLQAILEQADLVKFAKATPPVEVHPAALAEVRALLEATKQVAVATEPDSTNETTTTDS